VSRLLLPSPLKYSLVPAGVGCDQDDRSRL